MYRSLVLTALLLAAPALAQPIRLDAGDRAPPPDWRGTLSFAVENDTYAQTIDGKYFGISSNEKIYIARKN